MKLEFNNPAFYALRREPGVVNEINKTASELADSAKSDGGDYGWESHQGKKAPQGRWRATVFTKDREARENNARGNTLLGKLGGG